MIRLNPYTPGAAVPPRHLAGREDTLDSAAEALEYISQSYIARSIVYYGLRGVGKTVLLNQIESMAEGQISSLNKQRLRIEIHLKAIFPCVS